MRTFIVMITFFTRIPIPVKFDVEYKDYVKGIAWLPIISLIIGAGLFGLSILFKFLGLQGYVMSVIIALAYVLLTGGLHIDGLADTLDAFGSNRGKQRALEIMKDSRIGTFGVLGIAIYFISLVIIIPVLPSIACLMFPLVGRTAALFCAKANKYAREEGMGKSFVDGASWVHIALSLMAIIAVVALIVHPSRYWVFVVGLVIAIVITMIMVKKMSRKIDGITGDIVGFSIETSQLVFLYSLYLILTVIAI